MFLLGWISDFFKWKNQFFFQFFFFQNFQFLFNIALNLTFGHIQPLIPVAETEGQKLKTFDLAKSFGLWYTTGGHVIQANGRLTFEDDLRSGGLLWQWTSVCTGLVDIMVTQEKLKSCTIFDKAANLCKVSEEAYNWGGWLEIRQSSIKYAWSLRRATHGPSVWCSMYYFFFLISCKILCKNPFNLFSYSFITLQE